MQQAKDLTCFTALEVHSQEMCQDWGEAVDVSVFSDVPAELAILEAMDCGVDRCCLKSIGQRDWQNCLTK